MMHRTPPNCLERHEADAKEALETFRKRVQLMRWQIAEIIEPMVQEHPFHARRYIRETACNHLDDMLADLAGDLETDLSNAVIEAEDAAGDVEARDLRRSSPVVL